MKMYLIKISFSTDKYELEAIMGEPGQAREIKYSKCNWAIKGLLDN